MFVPPNASAQKNNDESIETLDPVVVSATRSGRKEIQVPNALSRVQADAVSDSQPNVTLEERLQSVPGVFIQNPFNFAQDLRLSIRGFGARSPFGVRGLKILVDDIPHTLPDGQSQLDSIDPALIQSLEVLRGPSASLYGNASGGMIAITTRGGLKKGREIGVRQLFGEFGLLKTQMEGRGRMDAGDYSVYGSRLKLNGFRDHSKTENLLFQFKVNIQNKVDSDWMVVFRKFYSPEAQDAGGLTLNEADANRQQAGPRNLQFDTGEEVDQESLGIRFRKQLRARREWTFTSHFVHRRFANRLPFVNGGTVEFDRLTGGATTKWVDDHPLFSKSNRFIVGLDFAVQNDDRQRFNNNFGRKGGLTLDQTESVYSIGPYFREEWTVHPVLDLVAGGRWDWMHYRVADAFLNDGDQSGSRTLSQGSGTLGVVWHVSSDHHLYGNVSTVFEAPTTTELINNPSGLGGFNPDLDSQTSLSHEVGIKGTSPWTYQLSGFFIRSRDEITPFQLPAFPGRSFFRNAGRTRRLGMEGWVRSPQWKGWQGEISYAYSDFTFDEFSVGGVSLNGNQLPGIPRHRWFGKIRYRHPRGWYAQFGMEHVSGFFVDNINSVQNNRYNAGQVLVGWDKTLDHWKWNVHFGINNVLDERYNANVRINAAGGRFFEPAPPLNLFGGLALTYLAF